MRNGKTRSWVFNTVILAACAVSALADGEFTGQFETKLLINPESVDRIVLKSVTLDKLKGKISLPEDAHLAAARLVDPRT